MEKAKLLENFDVKCTSARIEVLDVLESAQKPLDVVGIISGLKKKSVEMDRVTVFRIINLFAEKGIVRKLEFDEGKFRYELSSLPHHHHAICSNCGTVQDIENCDVEDLEKKIQKDLSFKINSHRLEFFGLCAKCQ